MTSPQIDVARLGRPQLEKLTVHLDQLGELIIAANNTMTVKLAETEEMPARCKAILNEWSTFLNSAIDKSNAEVAAILSVRAFDKLN